MTNPVERLRAKLPSAKRAGRGWIARCPAHDDRRPSLSIAQGDDGRALIRCHAGCPVDAICAAMGIAKAELFPNRAGGHTRGPKSPARPATSYATAREAVAVLERRLGRRSASWTYHDVGGDPVGVVLRWDRPDGKDIRPVSRVGSRWIVGAMPTPRPLYRLPELAAASRVFVTEGEKAADAARSVGLVATTSAHGSKSASKTDWTPLAGRECVLLPDYDDAGRAYADSVLAQLSKLSPLPLISVIQLPGLPPGGDIVEFIALRGGGDV